VQQHADVEDDGEDGREQLTQTTSSHHRRS
jgi:hypothetical protein